MLLREINTAYCDNHAERIKTLCAKILDILEVLHIVTTLCNI